MFKQCGEKIEIGNSGRVVTYCMRPSGHGSTVIGKDKDNKDVIINHHIQPLLQDLEKDNNGQRFLCLTCFRVCDNREDHKH